MNYISHKTQIKSMSQIKNIFFILVYICDIFGLYHTLSFTTNFFLITIPTLYASYYQSQIKNIFFIWGNTLAFLLEKPLVYVVKNNLEYLKYRNKSLALFLVFGALTITYFLYNMNGLTFNLIWANNFKDILDNQISTQIKNIFFICESFIPFLFSKHPFTNKKYIFYLGLVIVIISILTSVIYYKFTYLITIKNLIILSLIGQFIIIIYSIISYLTIKLFLNNSKLKYENMPKYILYIFNYFGKFNSENLNYFLHASRVNIIAYGGIFSILFFFLLIGWFD